MRLPFLLLLFTTSLSLAQFKEDFEGCETDPLRKNCWEFINTEVSKGFLTGCAVVPTGTEKEIITISPILCAPKGSDIKVSFDYVNLSPDQNLIVSIVYMDGAENQIFDGPFSPETNVSFGVNTDQQYFKLKFQFKNYEEGSPMAFDNLVVDGKVTLAQKPGACDEAFPVRLSSFTALSKPEGILLTWKTSLEIENKLFELYRSNDAVSFEMIASVNPKLNKTYQFLDANLNGYQYYYKLHQIDLNGSVNPSRIIAVKNEKLGDIIPYPNPSSQFLSLNVPQIDSYIIYSANGKTVQKSTTPISDKINIESLGSGSYILNVQIKGTTKELRFIKP